MLIQVLYQLTVTWLEKKNNQEGKGNGTMLDSYNILYSIYTKREDNKTFITGKTKYMYTYIENQ